MCRSALSVFKTRGAVESFSADKAQSTSILNGFDSCYDLTGGKSSSLPQENQS